MSWGLVESERPGEGKMAWHISRDIRGMQFITAVVNFDSSKHDGMIFFIDVGHYRLRHNEWMNS